MDNLPKHFPDSMWAQLNYEDNKPWGRVWVNPTFSLTDMTSFFKNRGFKLQLLPKSALLT